MRVIFLRHGESEYNIENRINQDPNMPVHLTTKGKKQAADARKKLESIEFDVAITSDFTRTKETAEIVLGNRSIPVFEDKRVSEAKTGFEGKDAKDYKLEFLHDFFNFKLKGKESWQDVKKRVNSFLKELKKETYQSVLVVTHEWVAQIANEIVNGYDDKVGRNVSFGNCEFFDLEL